MVFSTMLVAHRDKYLSAYRRLRTWVQKQPFYQWLKDMQASYLLVFGDIWICAYALLAVLALNIGVPITAQGSELGGAVWQGTLYTSSQDFGHIVVSWILVVLSVIYCALCIWLAASGSIRNAKASKSQSHGGQIAAQEASAIPLWLASLVFFSAFGLIFGHAAFWAVNTVSGLWLLAMPFLPYAFPPTEADNGHRHPLYRLARKTHRALTRHWNSLELICLGIGVALFVLTLAQPVKIPRALTTWTLIYAAMGFWPLIGSRIFISWPRLHGFASLWLVPIVLGIAFSYFNENHEVVGPEYGSLKHPSLQMPFEKYLTQWKVRQEENRRHCSEVDPCPLRIVAAEGGGLRAAYWTAKILRDLDIKSSYGFSKSVFALSTISGGSLGAAAYYASLNVNPIAGSAAPGPCDRGNLVLNYLGDDHLSPIMSSFMFSNALQLLLWWPIGDFDRAKPFKENMAELWSDHLTQAQCKLDSVKQNIFDVPLATLATLKETVQVPALFLNSTNVETGKRFIMSTVAKPDVSAIPDQERDIFSEDSYWALDPKGPLQMTAIDLKSAVTLSASFPLITPAGTLYEHCTDGSRLDKLWGRMVDGGYYDGTGLMTAFDIAQAVRDRLGEDKRFPIQIIFISNDPATGAAQQDIRDRLFPPVNPPSLQLLPLAAPASPTVTASPVPPAKPPGLFETEAIIDGMVHAHYEEQISNSRRRAVLVDRRAFSNQLAVCIGLVSKVATGPSGFCEISLSEVLGTNTESRPALGWWLSAHSKSQMDRFGTCYVDNLAPDKTRGTPSIVTSPGVCASPTPTPSPTATAP